MKVKKKIAKESNKITSLRKINFYCLWLTVEYTKKINLDCFYSLWSSVVYLKWAATWENRIFANAKTKRQISFTVTAKLISIFVFATGIVQSLFFLNPKFQASSHLQWLHSFCQDWSETPEDWFSHVETQILTMWLFGILWFWYMITLSLFLIH